MALSWNEIKNRAVQFSRAWQNESRERAEKDSFYNDFFHIFGISRRRVASFEEPVRKLNQQKGFIDLFWKGTLLVEHKSKGKNLETAYEQALDYLYGIPEHELPNYILVSDFEYFKLYDLEEKTQHQFHLSKLHENVRLFGFMAGYAKRSILKEQDPVNIEAAELMGKLHDQLQEIGYEGHPLEVFLVRLLFCLFAEDTGIFEKNTFRELIDQRSHEDGSDLGAWLAQLFQVLNTPPEKRLKSLDEQLQSFPYVNGKLFEEMLPISAFNPEMRTILLKCSQLNWGKISPAIFGSMFQSVMNPKERRNLGAHYTSEKNILRLIKPLFLDELHEEFQKIKSNKNKLLEFSKKLASLKFFDPACGCGNFLIITYRELRLLELEVLKELHSNGQLVTDIKQIIQVDVDQFYGIEYDEFPARIAEVALWLIDHQMNVLISETFGEYFARLPLRKSATIIHGNALQLSWNQIISPNELSFILGNPPFVGKKEQSKSQKEDMKLVFNKVKGAGVLDYVTAWYLKASQMIQNTKIKVGFVSTNSIAQGEQTGILWNELFTKYRIKIHFAHRTFQWKNEAKGNAAVHVVMIGFANFNTKNKLIFEYEDIKGEPLSKKVKNINPYLIEGEDLFIQHRRKPLCEVQEITYGSFALDDGNYTISKEEHNQILVMSPNTQKFLKPFIGGRELLRGIERYCIWLKDVSPNEIRKNKLIREKVERVKNWRAKSSRKNTQKLASTPSIFAEIRQPDTNYLAFPTVSSVNREYIPIAYLSPNVIASNQLYTISNAQIYDFGLLTSKMHMTWVKYVCGRLKSDFRYSSSVVYNNYPFPKEPSTKNQKKVEKCAQKVLDVRAEFAESSLADLYDPLTMPPKLVKAHQALDKAVDLCYRPQVFPNESSRIEFLFDLYHQYVTPLLETEKQKQKRVRKTKRKR